MVIITSVIDSRDGVFTGGKRLHHTFKPMTNNELTLHQLQTIAGGGVFAKLDGIKGSIECKVPSLLTDNDKVFELGGNAGPGGSTYPAAKIGGSSDPGGDDI